MRTRLLWALGVLAILALAGYAAFQLSPWPSALAIRPPAFVSVGNGDPLAPQSRALAQALAARGVRVDTLFFPEGHAPALPHEYQFNLDTEAGRLALERSLKFLAER